MSANSLRTLLRKLEPLFTLPFDLPTFATVNQPFLPFSYLLNSCHSLAALKRLHTLALTTGYLANLPVCTKLISLACSLSFTMDYARKLFDQMPQRDVFAWNTIIRGYSNLGPCQEAIILYKDMHLLGFLPDNYTFPFVLRSCSVLSALREGREVHCSIIKHGFESDVFVQSCLITLYAQSGETLDSELVFDRMRGRNIVSWTAMIAGYVQNGIPEKGLGHFLKMVNSGTLPNAITLVSVLPACARLECLDMGMLVHGYSIKLGVETDVALVNALIAFYGKCGLLDVARSLFDQMKEHSLVSWNTIIAAYEQNDAGSATIKLFQRMLDEGVEFDYITLVTVISACARLGALGTGKWVHELVKSKCLECNVPITNALIDMYAKCGSIELARDVFDRLPYRSVVSWTSIIGACASHGHGKDALEFFSRMKEEGIQPNSFTFTAVLTACRHSGLVEEGRKHFESMTTEYSIMPGVEQCACMVDLLGRAGQLLEAYEFVENMPIEPDADVWGALLGACKIHGNLELAESVADRLLDLNPQTVPFYILMKNIYAEAGRWEEVARLKFLLEEVEAEKIPGKSSVEINQRIHTFLSGSRISNFSTVPLREHGVQLKHKQAAC
ncbi:PREDICTED: pentatricopeptide repeat-containing protein At2g29760, chloroplastic-like [Nicotiana attenuata]|uniref:Pentatricopeptide repeat-containing protein, chloroplastic n=1 Tax=Nicotiana attenuata TaxID=49451 RepID=A0A314KTX0_NICAT|nr:PREDICTED: pentatricopeptide repeat-containing protein At2g29760, chloroplastic-like [Nicotiana attenuata]OIT32762.1 pentatricopeptide repeat-containing protein, chloroplastic [Nicotiana attenuata]